MQKRFLPSIGALLIVTGSLHADEPQKYQLTTKRPNAVGDKFDQVIELTNSTETTTKIVGIGKPDTKVDKSSATLSGTKEILAINSNGGAVEFNFLVTKFALKGAPNGSPVVVPGKVIRASRKGGKATFEIDGKAVTGAAAEVLKDAISPARADDESTGAKAMDGDAALGLKEARAAGERWSLEDEAVLAQFGEEGMPLATGDDAVNGEAKLEKVGDVRGIPCATLTGSILLKLTSAPGLPAEMTTDRSEMRMTFSDDYPLDGKTQPLRSEMKTEMTFVGSMAKGAIKVEMTAKSVSESRVFTRVAK